jgi:hypothetical protein
MRQAVAAIARFTVIGRHRLKHPQQIVTIHSLNGIHNTA